MSSTIRETYKGWGITVAAEKNMCANFSFDITDPAGRTQHVAMGGDDSYRAMERAKEMIDMERAVAGQETEGEA